MKITDSRFLLTFAILLVSWAFVYQDALIGMEDIWSRSDTFAHGYFILPISVWLIWRDKTYLLSSNTQTTWLPLPILFGSLFVWLFAFAADINVLGQLSAVVSLIALIWLVIGNKLTWRYKFPLAYLIFAVPMGENLIPMLQDITAWFTVNLLKLNGIPVYIDGLYIQIPTGLFEVAVACSGIRYLIASIAVGTLYAYLTYTSTKKQIIFILFSIAMPIVANGIRAYGIVAIAYYSDMKYATGADHLVYGWLFFGVVIMLMFWVGGFFADPVIQEQKGNERDQGVNKELTKWFFAIPVLSLITFSLTAITLSQISIVNKPDEPLAAINTSENYKTVNNSTWGIAYEDALQRSHVIDRQGVEVFRAVYANRQDQGELISWKNKAFDETKWTLISDSDIILNNIPAKLLFVRSTTGNERSIIYWYNISDSYFIHSTKAKLQQAVNVYLAPKSTAEVIAFSVESNNNEQLIASAKLYLSRLKEIKLPYVKD